MSDDIPTSEVVCPVCDRFVYNNPRCVCTGSTLRSEIERLRARSIPDGYEITYAQSFPGSGTIQWTMKPEVPR